jgi:hypothetical protein
MKGVGVVATTIHIVKAEEVAIATLAIKVEVTEKK